MHRPVQPDSIAASISDHRWSRSLARMLSPRKYLRVLPMRTRPSLFAGD